MAAEDIDRVVETLERFEETEQSRIFPNEAFAYRKVTVDRPLRLRLDLTAENVERLRTSGADDALADAMAELLAEAGDDAATMAPSKARMSLNLRGRFTAKREKAFRESFCVRDPDGEPVIRQSTGDRLDGGFGPGDWDPDRVPTDQRLDGVGIAFPHLPYGAIGEAPFPMLATFEPDPEMRDTEQIPLLESGGIAGFIEREVWPHFPDAWVDPTSERIGYEISFTRYFYQPQPLRTLDEIRADILTLEAETEGLLADILA